MKLSLQSIFKLQENHTTVSREIMAGVTTFAAMAYALTINPDILAGAGMEKPALITITALSGAIATILMALLSNYPLAMAPGMGINAMFTYAICRDMGTSWQNALGMVFITGIVFFILTVTKVRMRIVDAIPCSLKIAITCGIGMFIALLGFQKGGIIVSDQGTLVAAGDFASGPVALSLGGLLLTLALVSKRVPGAILLGVIITTIAGLFIHDPATGTTITAFDHASARWLPANPAPHLLKLRFDFLASGAEFMRALPAILTLLIISMFDSIGTLIGVTKRAGLLDKNGNLPHIQRAFMADSIAATLSALLGTSTVVSYVESASGVEAGGRTGLTGITVAALLLLALFLTPLILCIPTSALAIPLIIVGILMMQSAAEIKMDNLVEAAPAVLAIMTMPFMFSISNGIGVAIIAYVALALLDGKARSIPVAGYAIALIFFLKFFRIFPFN